VSFVLLLLKMVIFQMMVLLIAALNPARLMLQNFPNFQAGQ